MRFLNFFLSSGTRWIVALPVLFTCFYSEGMTARGGEGKKIVLCELHGKNTSMITVPEISMARNKYGEQ